MKSPENGITQADYSGGTSPNWNWNLYLRLLAIPFALSLLDMFLTLIYQPQAYWDGDYSQLSNEFNPIVWLVLRIHPLLLIPGFLGWYLLVFFLIFRTPSWIGLRMHLFLVLGHLIAISGWLIRNHSHGIALSAGLIVCALPLAAFFIHPYRRQWNGNAPLSQ